jgi:hypothetical protein
MGLRDQQGSEIHAGHQQSLLFAERIDAKVRTLRADLRTITPLQTSSIDDEDRQVAVSR